MFDEHLEERRRRGRARWREKLPSSFLLAGAAFVFFVQPLAPFYILIAGFYLGARSQRVRRWLIGNGEVPRTMLGAFAALLLALSAAMLLLVTPPEASDDIWLIMLLPGGWLAVTAPGLVASALLPTHRRREWMLSGTVTAFVSLGALVLLLLGAAIVLRDAQDADGLAFRRQVAIAAAISLVVLVVLPPSLRLAALRD